jgi:hypothetical protein
LNTRVIVPSKKLVAMPFNPVSHIQNTASGAWLLGAQAITVSRGSESQPTRLNTKKPERSVLQHQRR